VPEGVAPAYADALKSGAAAVGLLMSALPLGTVIGTLALVRLSPARRTRLVAPLALATAVPLVACAPQPGLVASIALWTASGVFAAYQVVASAAFVSSIPDHQRGRAVGLASSAVIATQGIGLVGFGFIADQWGAAKAIAFAGVIAFLLATPMALSWRRSNRMSHA